LKEKKRILCATDTEDFEGEDEKEDEDEV